MSGRQRRPKDLGPDYVDPTRKKSAEEKAAEAAEQRRRAAQREQAAQEREIARRLADAARAQKTEERSVRQAAEEAKRQEREKKKSAKAQAEAEAADLEERRQAARGRDAFQAPRFDPKTFDFGSLYTEEPSTALANAAARRKRRPAVRQKLKDRGLSAEQISDQMALYDRYYKEGWPGGRPALRIDKEPLNRYLGKLYYKDGFMFGRDRLYAHAQADAAAPAGLSRRYIARWLKLQEVHETTKPWKKDHVVQRRKAGSLPPTLFIDLKDQSVHAYDGFTWLMVGYDFDTKKLFSVPLKAKTADEVARGLRDILADARRKYKLVVSDNGKEFKNGLVDKVIADYGAERSFTASYTAAQNGGAERANRTFARMLGMARRHYKDGDDWPALSNRVRDNYNKSANPQLGGRTPDAAEDAFVAGDADTKAEIRDAINEKAGWNKANKPDPFASQPLAVDELVRIRLGNGGGLQKNADWNWSREPYKVTHVERYSVGGGQRRTRFKLVNRLGEEVVPGDEEFWQRDQISKYHAPMQVERGPQLRIINRILRPQLIVVTEKGKRRNARGYAVSYMNGDPVSYQTYEDLERDVPHLLTAFDDRWKVVWTPSGPNPAAKNFQWDLAFVEPPKAVPVAKTARTKAKKAAAAAAAGP